MLRIVRGATTRVAQDSPARRKTVAMTLSEAWREQAEAWARWARTPGHDVFYWRFNLPRFLEIVPEPGRRTIEVGCGEGRMCRELAARGHHVIGIDQSEVLVRHAADDRSTAVVLADGAALPVRDDAADLVISFMLLQDVDDLDAVVAELRAHRDARRPPLPRDRAPARVGR